MIESLRLLRLICSDSIRHVQCSKKSTYACAVCSKIRSSADQSTKIKLMKASNSTDLPGMKN